MSVYKRNGIWQAQIKIDGRRYRKTLKITTSKQDARDLEALWRTEILKGEAGIGKSKTPTVRELGVKFLNYLPGRVKPRSFTLYTNAWEKIDDFGPLATARLDKVDAPAVNQFAAHLQQKGFAVVSVNNTLRTLRRALFLAFEWKMLQREPRKVVKLLPGERQREYVLSETDEARVIAVAAPAVRGAITTAIDTGLRLGEISALEWRDVEMTGTNGNSTAVAVRVREGKTKNARRRVPITKRVAAVLEQLKTTARADVPYVFTRHSGRHAVSDQFLTMHFKKAVRKCSIDEACVFHSLRHTAATRMGASGASPFVMLKFFGWSSVTIAQRYCHPDAEQLEAAVARLGK